jgi:cytochrome P450
MFSEEWCTHHFDHLSPDLGEGLHPALGYLREHCPVAHSDQYGGYWMVTRYEDVMRVAQDWETFSSAQGVTVPMPDASVAMIIPEMVDPPLHREYKRLINAYFTQSVVSRYEQGVRDIVTRLIDDMIETGRAEFQDAFARPFPGMVFFEEVMHAPPDEVPEIVRLTTIGSMPTLPGAMDARVAILKWIAELVEQRRQDGPRGDVVDGVLDAEIEGRPITEQEIMAILQLLLFGGLDTTAGALGQMMIRFCREPAIPALLRERPDLVPDAIEELLRLDGPLAYLGRTATRDVELAGQSIKEGDKLLVSWTSANHDGAEFPDPETFDLDRPSNRHLAFGVGPHRCAGSNLARMDLRIAVSELVRRLHDLRLEDPSEPIDYHPGFSRAPAAVRITFTPGAREGAGTVATS